MHTHRQRGTEEQPQSNIATPRRHMRGESGKWDARLSVVVMFASPMCVTRKAAIRHKVKKSTHTRYSIMVYHTYMCIHNYISPSGCAPSSLLWCAWWFGIVVVVALCPLSLFRFLFLFGFAFSFIAPLSFVALSLSPPRCTISHCIPHTWCTMITAWCVLRTQTLCSRRCLFCCCCPLPHNKRETARICFLFWWWGAYWYNVRESMMIRYCNQTISIIYIVVSTI